MTASDPTPPSGECVSEEELEQYIVSDIGFVHDVLNQALIVDKTLEERHQAVKKARQQLRMTEAVLDKFDGIEDDSTSE
jgi:hypothetical protein